MVAKATKGSAEPLDEGAWVEAAMQVLAEGSIDKVGIVDLAKRLGVTKGSFYHHFKNHASLHDAMLRTWKQRATLAIIEKLERSAATPVERLRHLIELPYASPNGYPDADVELAIRAWAKHDDRARSAVAEVDELRLTYLSGLYKRLGFDPEDAAVRAYLIYSYNIAEGLIVTPRSPSNVAKMSERRARARDLLMGPAGVNPAP